MTHVTYAAEPGLEVPGEYVVEVERLDYEEFRPSRRAPGVRRLKWILRVTDGPHSGRVIYHNTSLDEYLVGLKRTLAAVGIETNGDWSFEHEDGGSRVTDPDVTGRAALVFIKNVRGFTRTRVAPVS